jgi:hypothetical protein
MKKLIYTIFILSLISSCKEQNTLANDTNHKEIDTLKAHYFDIEKSSFKIIKNYSTDGKRMSSTYIIEDVDYRVFRMLDTTSTRYNMTDHIAKIKKVSVLVNGSEGGLTKISAEVRNFENPNIIEFNIDETESDNIIFEPNMYRVIKNGCCESNGWIKLYNYQQKLIAEGEPQSLYKKYPTW